MNCAQKENRPAKYIIRVKNHLDTRWEHWFEGMTITQTENGVTILSGEVVDQSALHGLIEKIYNLNLSLVSLNTVGSETDEKGNFEREDD